MRKGFLHITLLIVISWPVICQAKMIYQGYGKLIFAADLIRHGARSSSGYLKIHRPLPDLWTKKNIPEMQLTQFGYTEQVNNGKYFKALYKNLFENVVDLSRVVCFRSDGANRDIMSSLGVMAGMFPGKIPFVIESIPREKDILLESPQFTYNLVSKEKVWKDIWHSSLGYPLYQKLLKKGFLKKTCPRYVHNGNYHACFVSARVLDNDLRAAENYCRSKKSRCKSIKLLTLSKDLQKRLHKLGYVVQKYNFLPPNQQRYKNSLAAYRKVALEGSGGVFVNEIIHNFTQVIKHKTPKKFILYAAHNTTIMSVFAYLANFDLPAFRLSNPHRAAVKFAADLSFRLYKKSRKKYLLRIIYRNDSSTNTPEIVVYSGSFAKFKSIYSKPYLLKKLDGIKRCDFL